MIYKYTFYNLGCLGLAPPHRGTRVGRQLSPPPLSAPPSPPSLSAALSAALSPTFSHLLRSHLRHSAFISSNNITPKTAVAITPSVLSTLDFTMIHTTLERRCQVGQDTNLPSDLLFYASLGCHTHVTPLQQHMQSALRVP